MDAILAALGGLLLRALPTFLLLLLLHFYLKYVFFRPLDRVLESRRAANQGAREKAEASLAAAARKSAEYEAAVRSARGEIYREQEETRRGWREAAAAAVEEARRSASEKVKAARGQIALQAALASESLAAESEQLAVRITEAILSGRPH
jgi:F-type H+-transporting ATPase subunit b